MRKWYCHHSSQRTIASYIFIQPVLSCNPQLGTCALPTKSSRTHGDLLALLGHGASIPIAHLFFLHFKFKHYKLRGFPCQETFMAITLYIPFLASDFLYFPLHPSKLLNSSLSLVFTSFSSSLQCLSKAIFLRVTVHYKFSPSSTDLAPLIFPYKWISPSPW